MCHADVLKVLTFINPTHGITTIEPNEHYFVNANTFLMKKVFYFQCCRICFLDFDDSKEVIVNCVTTQVSY